MHDPEGDRIQVPPPPPPCCPVMPPIPLIFTLNAAAGHPRPMLPSGPSHAYPVLSVHGSWCWRLPAAVHRGLFVLRLQVPSWVRVACHPLACPLGPDRRSRLCPWQQSQPAGGKRIARGDFAAPSPPPLSGWDQANPGLGHVGRHACVNTVLAPWAHTCLYPCPRFSVTLALIGWGTLTTQKCRELRAAKMAGSTVRQRPYAVHRRVMGVMARARIEATLQVHE